VRAFTLAVIGVARAADLEPGAAPVGGKQVSVIDVQVERATADGLLIAVSEVNRQLVAMCERIDLVVKGDRETELPVVLDGACDAATSKQGS
jgi:ribosomal silencing factor RsfS